jgi:hypothetical protein
MVWKGFNIPIWHFHHVLWWVAIYKLICGWFFISGLRATTWNSTKSNQTHSKMCSNGFLNLYYGGEWLTLDFVRLILGHKLSQVKIMRHTIQHKIAPLINHCFMFSHLYVSHLCWGTTYPEFWGPVYVYDIWKRTIFGDLKCLVLCILMLLKSNMSMWEIVSEPSINQQCSPTSIHILVEENPHFGDFRMAGPVCINTSNWEWVQHLRDPVRGHYKSVFCIPLPCFCILALFTGRWVLSHKKPFQLISYFNLGNLYI